MIDFSDLNPKQLNLLKQIEKNTEDNSIIRTKKYGNKDIEYLRSLGLVDVIICDKPNDYYYQPILSEKEKAFLHAKKKYTLRSNITLTLSIFAVKKFF